MGIAPKQINEQEILDLDSISLEQRKLLLLELDETNVRRGVYKNFIKEFKALMLDGLLLQHGASRKFRLLEIGSGNGGLAREILEMARGTIDIEYHMMDMNIDVLKWAQDRLRKNGHDVVIHPSTEVHLAQFKDEEFDIVISLHVLHHIHPLASLGAMFWQIQRMCALGFFMVDFERRYGNVLIGTLDNSFHRVIPSQRTDGIKSLRRAYSKDEIMFVFNQHAQRFTLLHRSLFIVPYQFIWGFKKAVA